jgi:hypothetical protein
MRLNRPLKTKEYRRSASQKTLASQACLNNAHCNPCRERKNANAGTFTSFARPIQQVCFALVPTPAQW